VVQLLSSHLGMLAEVFDW